MPGFSLNCLRTSSTIDCAALPTAPIDIDEKTNGKTAPKNIPISTIGFRILAIISLPLINVEFSGSKDLNSNILLPYSAKRAKAVNAALPIANPLPVAAVVLPSESRASVHFLTSAGR